MGQESLQARSERLAETTFLGGPSWDFERVGKLTFDVLLRAGLVPSSRVLDVGCGALRVGYWLLRFLDPGRYFGIEPNEKMLRVGLEQIVEPVVLQRAHARFASNDDFDFSGFGERFDFVIARSIWTHASKSQISAMLASFAETSAPGGTFLASYCPASPCFDVARRYPRLHRAATKLPLAGISPLLARLPNAGLAKEDDTQAWIGRSHESDRAAGRRHSLRWIAREASSHGLRAQLTSFPVAHHQYWLRIMRV